VDEKTQADDNKLHGFSILTKQQTKMLDQTTNSGTQVNSSRETH